MEVLTQFESQAEGQFVLLDLPVLVEVTVAQQSRAEVV